MQFIIEHQAKLTASAEKHDERIAKHDEQMAELRAMGAKHDERIAKNEEQIAAVTDLVGRLAQAEIRLVERMEGHEVRLASLESKATKLFDRMDRFIQGLEGNGRKPR